MSFLQFLVETDLLALAVALVFASVVLYMSIRKGA
jgi:hypothetical protein